jgi:hypothetical protein
MDPAVRWGKYEDACVSTKGRLPGDGEFAHGGEIPRAAGRCLQHEHCGPATACRIPIEPPDPGHGGTITIR